MIRQASYTIVEGSNCMVFTTFPTPIFKDRATMIAALHLHPIHTCRMTKAVKITLWVNECSHGALLSFQWKLNMILYFQILFEAIELSCNVLTPDHRNTTKILKKAFLDFSAGIMPSYDSVLIIWDVHIHVYCVHKLLVKNCCQSCTMCNRFCTWVWAHTWSCFITWSTRF